MKYYKLNNKVYAFDVDQLDLVAKDMVEMTIQEIDSHINPIPTNEQLASEARSKRDVLLNDTQWFIDRHRDQLDAGLPTTLTIAQHAALLAYRQALREVPEQEGFPAVIDWPVAP